MVFLNGVLMGEEWEGFLFRVYCVDERQNATMRWERSLLAEKA